jgi:hypothetical protein
MSDPLSLIALSAAVGGAAGKFAEKAWDSGEKWLKSYFANHGEKAQLKAKENSLKFLKELAEQIKELEAAHTIKKKDINSAMDHPQFSILLQKSILNSAQTDDTEKRALLARLVAERLKYSADSTYSLASKIASDAIASCTPRHLQLLGLLSFIQEIRWTGVSTSKKSYQKVLERILSPFLDAIGTFQEKELLHLEALSCITYQRGSERSLEHILTMKNGRIDDKIDWGERFDKQTFEDSDVGFLLNIMWTEGLAGVYLTSVGSIIGHFVFDEVMNMRTDAPSWK